MRKGEGLAVKGQQYKAGWEGEEFTFSNFFQIISKVLGRVCDPFLKPSQ